MLVRDLKTAQKLETSVAKLDTTLLTIFKEKNYGQCKSTPTLQHWRD